MCPHCGRDVPMVYRGVVPTCVACGGGRVPLTGPSLNLAGEPAKVGGTFASVAGGVVLTVGLSVALGLGLLIHALGSLMVALAFALPIALVTLAVGLSLVLGGRQLRHSGDVRKHEMRANAFVGLVEGRGAITAASAAQALGVSVAEADAALTELAKRAPDRVAMDIDEHGALWYRAAGAGLRARVDVGQPVTEARGAATPLEDDAVDPRDTMGRARR